MNVAIIGGRNFSDILYFKRCLIEFTKERGKITKVVSGKADGADTLAWIFATKYKIELLEFEALWEQFGKRAGFMRNQDIVDNSDIIIAFWDEYSKGTKSSIDLATKAGKEVVVYTYRDLTMTFGHKILYRLREEYLQKF